MLLYPKREGIELKQDRLTRNKKHSQRREFNGFNQLLSLSHKDGLSRYEYDALGRRSAKITSQGRIDYLWDGDTLLGECQNGDFSWYIFEPGTHKPLFLIKHGELYSYQLDQLGTPLSVTDSNNQIVWQAQYSSFGKATVQVNHIDNPIRFQGQYFDEESGLHYNHFRYYDPHTGRFISQDPIGLLGGINHYQYAPNHINWVDPLGLVCKEQLSSVNGVVFNGRIHRLEKPGQTETTWIAGSWNIDASHRYSEPGIGAVYGGTTKATARAEVEHYDTKFGYDTAKRKHKYKDVNIDNVLDLTSASVREHLGITLEDITATGVGQYNVTHEIGKLANDAGFNAILAPSARNPSGANLVVFGGF